MKITLPTRLKLSLLFSVLLAVCVPTICTGISEPAVRPSGSKTTAVGAVPHSTILEISREIDRLVISQLEENRRELNPLASDEVFLRRTYLNVIGRIPTLDETNRFLNSNKKNKRAELIDELLDSYGYVSRQFNFWADLLRIQSRQQGGLSGQSYIDFVKDSLENNLPYDEFVRQLIRSEGPSLERGNGSVGYYLRDINMPEDNMSNTVRLFLGTRLECAQCHDHPFDKWTQRQYFEMVAFTGGMQYRLQGQNDKLKMYRELKDDITENQRRVLQNVTRATSYGVAGTGTGLARLPEEYEGSDGYGGEIVVAKEMFESLPIAGATVPPEPKNKKNAKKPNKNVQQRAIRGAKPIDSREKYAHWMTESDNPRFATVIANRLWKQALGIGLIEPVDVIEDSTVASNPQLMEYLQRTIIELDFDMKQFLRAIYNSETFQAETYDRDVSEISTFDFKGPIIRRMSAEQIWDSMLTLTIPEVDERSSRSERGYGKFAGDQYDLYEKVSEMDAEELLAFVKGSDGQMNSKGGQLKDNPEYKELQKQRRELENQLKTARRKRDTAAERELLIKQAELMTEFRKSGPQSAKYVRASELQSPAPAGHFLREFGQSDREQIENYNTDPAVTQVLSMMNGFVEQNMSRDNSSLLMQNVLATTTADECISAVFLSMLNRQPTSSELRVWKPEFQNAVRKNDKSLMKNAYVDLIWTLANSNEFIFVK